MCMYVYTYIYIYIYVYTYIYHDIIIIIIMFIACHIYTITQNSWNTRTDTCSSLLCHTHHFNCPGNIQQHTVRPISLLTLWNSQGLTSSTILI